MDGSVYSESDMLINKAVRYVGNFSDHTVIHGGNVMASKVNRLLMSCVDSGVAHRLFPTNNEFIKPISKLNDQASEGKEISERLLAFGLLSNLQYIL